MASSEELHKIFNGKSQLKNRIEVALVIAAGVVKGEEPGTPGRRAWARGVFANPKLMVAPMLRVLVAENSDVDIAVIESANLDLIQPLVMAAVEFFATEA